MREILELRRGWHFCLSPENTECVPTAEERGWEQVCVPHDWAIKGPFSVENDPQLMEPSILDYKPGLVQTGRTGGLPYMGCGWYVLELEIPEGFDRFFLEFDGVMSRAQVFVNGSLAAERAYGYSSFCADITPFVRPGSRAEVVVRVNSLTASARWYPGAGILRPVRLVMTEASHISYMGVHADARYSPAEGRAALSVSVEREGESRVEHSVYAPDGSLILTGSGESWQAEIAAPVLWSPESPALYTLETCLYEKGRCADRVFTRFGVRSVAFDRDRGFILNGSPCELKGVCLHHDNGMLGAAWNADASRRQLEILRAMGCNAVRTTHNPAAPQFLDLCDELGFLVLEEAFDEWYTGKTDMGYCRDFGQWYERDLRDMILRDRNHPSIFLWSIGNEVPDQTSSGSGNIAKDLVDICRKYDSSRGVTCAFSRPDAAIENGIAAYLDVVGLNYCADRYQRYRDEHPDWCFLGTEVCSCVSSRDEFFQPARREQPAIKHENMQINSYDLSAPAFCYPPDVEFEAQEKAPWINGQFVWTGFDYLGEPTPYRSEWPSRSSYFGIVDLAGLPKSRYYAYKARWTKEPVLYLFPHWNWSEGDTVDVHCYTNLDRVSLYLNGEELSCRIVEGHRVVFGSIPFVPGELKAVGYKRQHGIEKVVCTHSIKTAGEPAAIRLIPEKESCRPGETVYVRAELCDAEGNICPHSAHRVDISVEGAGEYLASDGGDASSLRIFSAPYCEAFHGRFVIALRAGSEPGPIIVSASAEGISTKHLIITSHF